MAVVVGQLKGVGGLRPCLHPGSPTLRQEPHGIQCAAASLTICNVIATCRHR